MAFLFLEMPPEGGRGATSGRPIDHMSLFQHFHTLGMPHKKFQNIWKRNERKITMFQTLSCKGSKYPFHMKTNIVYLRPRSFHLSVIWKLSDSGNWQKVSDAIQRWNKDFMLFRWPILFTFWNDRRFCYCWHDVDNYFIWNRTLFTKKISCLWPLSGKLFIPRFLHVVHTYKCLKSNNIWMIITYANPRKKRF